MLHDSVCVPASYFLYFLGLIWFLWLICLLGYGYGWLELVREWSQVEDEVNKVNNRRRSPPSIFVHTSLARGKYLFGDKISLPQYPLKVLCSVDSGGESLRALKSSQLKTILNEALLRE